MLAPNQFLNHFFRLRFKDFNVISFGDEVAGDGSSFTITGTAESDNGFYQCRAVSSAMKKFSKSAEVIIRGNFTCKHTIFMRPEVKE